MPSSAEATWYRWGGITPDAIYFGTNTVWRQPLWVEDFTSGTWSAWTKSASRGNGTVSAGVGVLTTASTNVWTNDSAACYYRPISTADSEVTLRFSVYSVALSSVGIYLRVPSEDSYVLSGVALWINPDGSVQLEEDEQKISATQNPSFARANGEWYRVRLRVSAATIQAKLWADHAAEPSTWTISANASTRLSAGNFAVKHIGDASVTIRVDDVVARAA